MQRGGWVIACVAAVSFGAACGAPVMPALVNASDLEDPLAQTCEEGDLFADVPVEAMVLGDQLWVRGAGGTLAAVSLTGTKRINYHLDHERVLDLHHASSGALWALTIADGPGDMRLWQRTSNGWTPMWEMGAPSEAMALVELGGWPAVITPKRLYVATGELWTRELEPPLPDVSQLQTVARGSSVWVTARGVGWLYHLDASTGKVRGVSDVGHKPCSGLLDPTCDVISDLDPDVVEAGCALVTTRGRVLRACPDGSVVQAPGVARAVRAKWADQIRALALLYPEGSSSRLHLLSLLEAENPSELVRDNLADNLPTLDDDPIEAVATVSSGYAALGSAALYQVRDRATERHDLPEADTRCGLEVTALRDALVVNGSQPLPLLVSLDKPPAPPPEALPAPPPPCEDTVVFYAHGDPRNDDGLSVVMRCSEGAASMVQRAQPHDRTFAVPAHAWRGLWADLERAQWRSWKSCDPSDTVATTHGRFMISTPKHTLQVDCPPNVLNTRQRAVLERLRAMAEAGRDEPTQRR